MRQSVRSMPDARPPQIITRSLPGRRIAAQAMFLSGGRCVQVDTATGAAGPVTALTEHWSGLDGTGFESGVRAVVDVGPVTYAFRDDAYLRLRGGAVEQGFPLPVAANWPGFAEAGFADGVQAGLHLGNGKIYFFRGTQYLRFNTTFDLVDGGYPRPIGGNWPGMAEAGFAGGVDAAVRWPDGRLYFFRGEEYLRYDVTADRVEAGFPRRIADDWPGLAAAGITGSITAVWLR